MKNIKNNAIEIINEEQKAQDDIYELYETTYVDYSQEEEDFLEYSSNQIITEVKDYALSFQTSSLSVLEKNIEEKIMLSHKMADKLNVLINKNISLSKNPDLQEKVLRDFLSFENELFNKNIPDEIFYAFNLKPINRLFEIENDNYGEYIFWDRKSCNIFFPESFHFHSLIFLEVSKMKSMVFSSFSEKNGYIQWEFKEEYSQLKPEDVKEFCDLLMGIDMDNIDKYRVNNREVKEKLHSFFRNKLLSLKLETLPIQAELNRKKKI